MKSLKLYEEPSAYIFRTEHHLQDRAPSSGQNTIFFREEVGSTSIRNASKLQNCNIRNASKLQYCNIRNASKL